MRIYGGFAIGNWQLTLDDLYNFNLFYEKVWNIIIFCTYNFFKYFCKLVDYLWDITCIHYMTTHQPRSCDIVNITYVNSCWRVDLIVMILQMLVYANLIVHVPPRWHIFVNRLIMIIIIVHVLCTSVTNFGYIHV